MVGTLGSLKSLCLKRTLKLQSMRIIVFDEADEMLKVGGSLLIHLPMSCSATQVQEHCTH